MSLAGLSGPFSRFAPGQCPRCAAVVEATWPWSGWGLLRRAWFVALVMIAFASPVWMGDMYVLIPSTLIFVSAIGPLNSLARIRPTCLRCGGVVEQAGGNG